MNHMVNIDSSVISAVGYDAKRRLLNIKFKKDTHQYRNVPEEIYQGLLHAESPGSYFHRNIKYAFESEKKTWDCDTCEDVGVVEHTPPGSIVPQVVKCPNPECHSNNVEQ